MATCPRYQYYKRHQQCVFYTEAWSVIHNKKFKYRKIVCDIKPDKVKTHHTKLTVGGNLLDYSGVMSTLNATFTTTKCFLNRIVSTLNVRCLTADIKNFYLNNNLSDIEYIKLHISIIPKEIIETYSFSTIQENNGWVYIKICKGMYGLKQAGIITNL